MDKREGVEGNEYLKELQQEDEKQYKEYVEEEGKKYRVPYTTVREVVFTNLRKEELIDIEHCARLQYRLLLVDAILRAKVEFVKQKITVLYNPEGADSRKDKISLQGLVDMLAKEGVRIDPRNMAEKDVDYYKEIYAYQYNPPSIREHAPYGYTLDEWKKMKPGYERKKGEYEKAKAEKFDKFQEQYLRDHPELAKELNVEIKPEKQTFMSRIFGKKKSQEKGFWFHGV